ncbi:hypothetical protein HYX06_01380 [Candidatus Woesearchaeota archaeon]|nr:hypothetical protein [Candidatus Woesearchaeota archaeon]
MLKSLFFRQKAETDELLPPPPPFPSMELEEPKESASDGQFDDLFNDAEKELDLGHELKSTKSKPKKPSKRELAKLKKAKAKEAKLRKKEEKEKIPEEEFSDLGKGFNFDNELGPEQGFKDLEELGIGDLNAEKANSKEIEEAEEEITSAIEGAKKQGRKSLFSGLFKKKAEKNMPMPDIELGGLDAIKKRINDARNSLMNLDLESAKNCYVDIMRAYNKLNSEDQAKVYHEIRDLYYERKNAEEMKTFK